VPRRIVFKLSGGAQGPASVRTRGSRADDGSRRRSPVSPLLSLSNPRRCGLRLHHENIFLQPPCPGEGSVDGLACTGGHCLAWRVARSARAFWLDWAGERRPAGDAAAVAGQPRQYRSPGGPRRSCILIPARTFSSPRLLGELSTIADQVGVRSNARARFWGPNSQNQFSFNTVQLSVRNADMAALLGLYDELDKRAPYIGLEQFSLTINPSNPALLNIVMHVSSVEINR